MFRHSLFRYGWLPALLALLMACAAPPPPPPAEPSPPPLAPLTAASQPPGAQITVVETGRLIEGDDPVQLPAGRYTLEARMPGYAPASVTVDLDGLTPQRAVVPMGRGFADLTVTSRPQGAQIMIDGRPHGHTPGVILSLAEGDHAVALHKEGYYDARATVTITPGRPADLEIPLDRIPTSGTLDIVTRPAGGALFLNGRPIGTGTARLTDLAFGTYTVRGVLAVTDYERRVGQMTLDHTDPQTSTLTLPLDRSERLLDGRWLAASAALEQERARYAKQRVSHPQALEMALSADQYRQLAESDGLAENLHALLRVGDRLALSNGGRTWLLWKRHAGITPEFQAAVAAFRADRPHQDPWHAAAADGWRTLPEPAGSAAPLAVMALGLHAGRGTAPLLDLDRHQLDGQGETIWRSRADGAVTLVVVGSEAPRVDGHTPDPVADGLWVVHAPPADAPLTLAWTRPPDRLRVVGDAAVDFLRVPAGGDLKAHEKQVVQLVEGPPVRELLRLTHGPDHEGWQRRLTRPSGPLADQIDLRRDEIGPHDTGGDYRRIWLVRVGEGAGARQRQVGVDYTVAGGVKDFSSDTFLRRPAQQ